MSLSNIILLSFLVIGNSHTSVLPKYERDAPNSAPSLTLLYQNNLNASDDSNHVGVILTEPVTYAAASQICASVGQTLITQQVARNYSDDLALSLNYERFAGRISPSQQFWIDGALLGFSGQSFTIEEQSPSDLPLPALCSNNANATQPQNSTAISTNKVTVQGGTNTYQGYFNAKSFRFLGIRYAEQPIRFEHSQLHMPVNEVINATSYGDQCLQSGGGNEDCLFLNIQTPYIPGAGSSANLRPVMFWIHGGGEYKHLTKTLANYPRFHRRHRLGPAK